MKIKCKICEEIFHFSEVNNHPQNREMHNKKCRGCDFVDLKSKIEIHERDCDKLRNPQIDELKKMVLKKENEIQDLKKEIVDLRLNLEKCKFDFEEEKKRKKVIVQKKNVNNPLQLEI